MKYNIKHVAQHANVSTATVSHVINNTRYVAPETKSRVKKSMNILKYQPNSVAKSLRTNKTKTIGVLLPTITYDPLMLEIGSNDQNTKIINGIRQGLQAQDYFILLGSLAATGENELQQIMAMNARRVDGLIMLPHRSGEDYSPEAHGANTPIVFVDRNIDGEYGDIVMSDNYTGAYDAVNVLIQKGHKKIGIVTIDLEVSTLHDRIRAYKNALKDAGIEIDEGRILSGNYNLESYPQAFGRYIEQSDATAIFLANNPYAAWALKYINDKGIKVPKDLAFIAFDDFDYMENTSPTLSAVRQPFWDMGLKAAELLLDRIQNKKKPYETVYLPTQLILRESI